MVHIRDTGAGATTSQVQGGMEAMQRGAEARQADGPAFAADGAAAVQVMRPDGAASHAVSSLETADPPAKRCGLSTPNPEP